MKITSVIYLLTISLCASLCCTGEDDYTITQIEIQNNNLIKIENNQDSFNVGDNIVIETIIPLEQTTTNNQNISLANYDYSEINDSAYRYSIALFKQNDFGSISKIPLSASNINEIEGTSTIENGSVFVQAFFDGTTYNNKFSITLAESGTYFLAGNRFLNSDDGHIYISGGVSEYGFVTIFSNIINANTSNAYEFNVNE